MTHLLWAWNGSCPGCTAGGSADSLLAGGSLLHAAAALAGVALAGADLAGAGGAAVAAADGGRRRDEARLDPSAPCRTHTHTQDGQG